MLQFCFCYQLRFGSFKSVISIWNMLTRPKRSALAATNAAIQNSVQRDATTTRLGGKKKTYPRN